MKYMLAKKVLFLLISAGIAMIALSMVEGLIKDRLYYQNEARESIAASWSGEQQIIGPILVVPYSYEKTELYWDKVSESERSKIVTYAKQLYIIPEQMHMDADLLTQERSKGLFSFPVYTAKVQFAGEFELSALHALRKSLRGYGASAKLGEPYLGVSVGDMRGINNRPTLLWQGNEHVFEAGSRLFAAQQGIHVPMPDLAWDKLEASFSFTLSVRGMDALWFTPIAKETSLKLNAAWPHPNFKGRFLPNTHTIDAESFQAEWKLSEFSTDIIRDVRNSHGNGYALQENRFGVYLDSPVDIYRQSIRSTKYGFLFVGLTFISFFVFEILKKLRIHPVQYTLISFSLAIFYLLLVALAETLGFMLAYVGATLACVSLLTLYVCSILKNVRWGLAFGAFVTVLYTLLYIILRSEDHALLLGSGLVFAMLGMVMFATRHVDWYAVSSLLEKKAGEGSENSENSKEESATV